MLAGWYVDSHQPQRSAYVDWDGLAVQESLPARKKESEKLSTETALAIKTVTVVGGTVIQR